MTLHPHIRWLMPRATVGAVAATIGVLLALMNAGKDDFADRLYDRAFPIITGSAKLVDRTTGYVTVHMNGTKHRPCQFLRIVTFARIAGVPIGAFQERIDQPAYGRPLPLHVNIDFGLWRLFPIDGATSMDIYMQHECRDGEGMRKVTTHFADVVL